jgi:hypothetical protein
MFDCTFKWTTPLCISILSFSPYLSRSMPILRLSTNDIFLYLFILGLKFLANVECTRLPCKDSEASRKPKSCIKTLPFFTFSFDLFVLLLVFQIPPLTPCTPLHLSQKMRAAHNDFSGDNGGHWIVQGGAGIRMPDRTPVGWLPLGARKKINGPCQIFCPLRPIWAQMIMQVPFYTTWDSKAHKKCKCRVLSYYQYYYP